MAYDRSTPDIRSFLAAACRPERLLGRGTGYAVYALGDGPEWAPYALRVPHESVSQSLRSTTVLSTPRHRVSGIHIGQTLLEDSHSRLSIVARQEGASVFSGYDASRHQPHLHTGLQVMEPLLAEARKGRNPCLPVIDTAYRLLRAGYRPDLHWKNLLWDDASKTLRLVDQMDGRLPPQSHDDAMRAMGDSSPYTLARHLFDAITQHDVGHIEAKNDPATPRHYLKDCERVAKLVARACDQIDARYKDREPAPIFAATTQPVRLAVSDGPQRLLQQLRQLHAPEPSPQRA